MVVWQSYLIDPQPTDQLDMYSSGNSHPQTNQVNTYTTTVTQDLTSNMNVFVSYRALEATGDDTYTIPLDQNIKMVYAFLPTSGTLKFHERNFGFFNI